MTSVQTAETRNPYLEGLLAPVSAEVTATDLRVTGHIPEHLDGRYLRNGPNPAEEVDPATYHWFSGDGMVHGVALRDGKARWYRNRWVRSLSVCATLGEPTPARLDPRAGMLSLGANTNVLTHAGRTLALVEGGVANYELTDELDTVATCDFDGTLAGGYTAHPHRDPRTGELHAVSYSFARGRTVQYSVIDTHGRARRTVDIEVSGSPMMHDFSLTDKYVVIYDLPVTFDPMQVLPVTMPRWLGLPARLALQSLIGRVRVPSPINAMMNRNPKHSDRMPYAWNPGYPARIGVMPREGGNKDVRWFEIEPCYVYHPLNAYSEMRDGAEVLVLDVVRYARMFDRDRRGPGDSPPTLDRWTINLATGAVSTECRDERAAGISPDQRGPAGRAAPVRLHRRCVPLRRRLRAVQARLRDRDPRGRAARSRPSARRDVLCAESRGRPRRRRHPDGLRLSPRPRRGPVGVAGRRDARVGGHRAPAPAGTDGLSRQLGAVG